MPAYYLNKSGPQTCQVRRIFVKLLEEQKEINVRPPHLTGLSLLLIEKLHAIFPKAAQALPIAAPLPLKVIDAR